MTSVREDPAEAIRAENRKTRAENYAAKLEAGWACAECGSTDRVLVVEEKTSRTLTTRCEANCLDRRSHDVRPLQFDERERLEAARR